MFYPFLKPNFQFQGQENGGGDLGRRVDVESLDINFVRNFWTEWCMCRSVIVGKQSTVFLIEFLSFLSHCFLQKHHPMVQYSP